MPCFSSLSLESNTHLKYGIKKRKQTIHKPIKIQNQKLWYTSKIQVRQKNSKMRQNVSQNTVSLFCFDHLLHQHSLRVSGWWVQRDRFSWKELAFPLKVDVNRKELRLGMGNHVDLPLSALVPQWVIAGIGAFCKQSYTANHCSHWPSNLSSKWLEPRGQADTEVDTGPDQATPLIKFLQVLK